MPKPAIFTLSEFLVPGVKKEICKIITTFPSQLKTLEGNKTYVEGGMILLRLDKSSIKKENLMKFEIKYKNEMNDKKESVDIEYSFKKGDFVRKCRWPHIACRLPTITSPSRVGRRRTGPPLARQSPWP